MMRPMLIFAIHLIACVLVKAINAHVCKLNEIQNLETGLVLWSLPSQERCLCQGVVAIKNKETCAENYLMDEELWFTTNPKPLTRRENWTPEAMDMFLNRSILCYTDECISNPCQHDGICHDRIGAYVCICDNAYVGQTCEIAIWSSWESWTTCSVTCGNGTQTRRRLCGYGLETDLCDGETQQNESKPCHESLCL
ncbi:coagulation factor XII-like [Amphiura filiformis]|uniref:coagulation factor XII-like n=1 Tax=Amphiura filiformis TaxID=82378 RepID=UPI003B227744